MKKGLRLTRREVQVRGQEIPTADLMKKGLRLLVEHPLHLPLEFQPQT